MNQMGLSREACDRCHAMKTRCVRQNNSRDCSRCARLGAACHYSPPGRTGRPLGAKKRQKSGVNEQDISPQMTVERVPVTPCNSRSETNFSHVDAMIQEFSCFDEEQSQTRHMHQSPCSINLDELFDLTGSPSAFLAHHPPYQTPPTSTHPPPYQTPPTSVGPPSLVPVQPKNMVPNTNNNERLDLLSHLLDVQMRLSTLLKSLTQGLHTSQDIEEIYRLSEAFVTVLKNSKTLDSSPYSSAAATSSVQTQVGSCGMFSHLVATNYFNLIHAYELLVHTLHSEPNNPEDLLNASSSNSQSQSLFPSPSLPAEHINVPAISIGACQLSLPRKAVTEISLRLIAQIFQQVKAAMQDVASKVVAGQLASSSLSSSVDSAYSASDDGSNKNSGTITDLAETALCELKLREEKLEKGLRVSS